VRGLFCGFEGSEIQLTWNKFRQLLVIKEGNKARKTLLNGRIIVRDSEDSIVLLKYI